MATAPRPGVGRRAAAETAHISLSIDGQTYTVRLAELSAMDAAALRSETGFALRSLLAALGNTPDLDVLAAMVWLAHRQAGDVNPDTKRAYSFTEVAEAIGYDTPWEAVEEPAEEDEASPEA